METMHGNHNYLEKKGMEMTFHGFHAQA